MDAEKCAVLLEVLECGSLSAAAEKLGYTPSGMSRLIAALEHEVGFTLLSRGRFGVIATAECKALIPALTEFVAAERTCEELAASILGLEQGRLVVGSAYPQFYHVLAEIIVAFSGKHPGIRIDIVQANSSILIERMERREIDFALVSKRENVQSWTSLMQDDMVAVLPKDHPFAAKKTFPIGRFAEEAFIEVYPGEESDNSRTLKACGVEPNVRHSVHDTKAAFALVEAGLGITMMNDIFVRNADADVVWIPVSPHAAAEIGIATPQGVPSPALEAFSAFALPQLKRAKI
ncbi:MAG: LysR family transcriptional regulator [Eggerthellaceae bacterium]|jgi:DNA-binding transcriptional LysR family regulator